MPAGIAKLKSLQTLCFRGMSKWQDWIPCGVEGEEFPCLRELSISKCPKLGEFSYHLSSLEKLSIHACKQLVVSIPSHSVIQVLEIVGCKEVVHGSVKVEKLIIKYCEELTSLCQDGLTSLVTLGIEIESCQSLVNIKLKSTLRTLKIRRCSALESFEFVMDEGGVSSTSSLLMNKGNLSSIGNNNASIVTLEIEIESCQSLVNIKLKSTLRTLKIRGCSALESLEFVMDEGGVSSASSLLMNKENLSSISNNSASLLEHLEISKCPSLKCITTIVDLAAMLKHLQIVECPNQTSLSSRDTLPTTLEVLRLEDCPKLESIVHKLNKDTLLEHLLIKSCEELRCLPRGLHELCHLKEIDIYKCNSLISLGDLLPTNLRSLKIQDCEKLEALPNNMHNLNFLQNLSIINCPSIVSFPEEGFPTSLRKLHLFGANLCEQVFELGLHRLTSLTLLELRKGIMDSFPEEEDGKTMLMLPSSLTTLCLWSFPNLLFLSWKFDQNTSALEGIDIAFCPKLVSLSEKCFPPSLQRLKIYGCPVLAQNCEKDKGIMWSKIAKIPSVELTA